MYPLSNAWISVDTAYQGGLTQMICQTLAADMNLSQSSLGKQILENITLCHLPAIY